MVKIIKNVVKRPEKQINGFHLRNYGWSSDKRKGERFVALMMAVRDVENENIVKNRMLELSQWNRKMCYDTYTFWDDLSYGDIWYLENACELVEALKST